MENINSKSNDLFLLMFNLSQLTLKETIISLFTEALNEIWPDSKISFIENSFIEDKQENIISLENNYGFIKVKKFSSLRADDQALIQNACGLISIILKRNEQDNLLADEKLLLKKLVEEKTLHLKKEIGKHKNTLGALKESQYLLEFAGKIAKFGGWIVNIEENRVIWSDEVSVIHEMPKGYSPTVKEAINFYAPECRDTINKVYMACVQEGKSYNEILQIITSKGKRLWVNAIGKAVKDKNGKIVRTIGGFQDITELKKSEEEIKENLATMNKTFEQTVSALSYLVELRDPYTSGHQKRVAQIAVQIAEDMKIDSKTIEAIRLASLLHDIGKITIPLSILSRPGKISPIEMEMIKTHPLSGYDIVKDIDFLYPIAKIILQHHERINGSGYPNGLKGNKIMKEAKIITVADVIEAVTSHRPYRPALSFNEVENEIKNNMGILYDSDVCKSCLKKLKILVEL